MEKETAVQAAPSAELAKTQPSSEAAMPGSFVSRLAGVYGSPTETFKDMARSPGVLLPMIMLAILGMITTYCTSLKVNLSAMALEPIIEQQVAQGRMTQEQADQLRERTANQSEAGKIVGAVAAGILSILTILIAAAVAKLISTAFLGAENRFGPLFSVSLYAWLAVGIVHGVLFLVILYFKDPADLTVSSISMLVASSAGAILTGIMGEGSLPNYLAKLLNWVDIFAIWKIALLAIGYAAVSRKLKTAKAAAWIVAIYVVMALIAAALPPMFG